MPSVYLDHNVVVGIACDPLWPDAATERTHLDLLRRRGVQFTLSAWHAYELVQSKNELEITQYCEFVERLEPSWANDQHTIKKEELLRYLARLSGTSDDNLPPVRPFSSTMTQMWASYGTTVIIGETFRNTIRELQRSPEGLDTVTRVADVTPPAIATARRAMNSGIWKKAQPVVDEQYLASILGCDVRDARVRTLLENLRDMRRSCPVIRIEEEITNLRARDSFKPKRSHAADLQHSLAGLPYCQGFVTDDRNLLAHCRTVQRRLALSARVCTRILELTDVV